MKSAARADAAQAAGKPVGQGDFVTVFVADQLFGISVRAVRDVLGPQRITRIPLAPPEVAGALNLRGRVVTAIDVRRRLGLPARANNDRGMSVVVESGGELYGLIVDSIAEVLNLPPEGYERNPSTLSPRWREISAGIHRLDERLMVVLDIDSLLRLPRAAAGTGQDRLLHSAAQG
jgi:purine-binding chemotaxis protein CheW